MKFGNHWARLRALAALCVLAATGACGTKGPLVLPPPEVRNAGRAPEAPGTASPNRSDDSNRTSSSAPAKNTP